ncbi:MAG: CBS domain-containing protein [Nitrososphaerota archaeon]|nr:CBS domain-containing protein [Nitrososphaerales archaeon]MCX8191640.1 CBS domain-containing protein [Nitrososphaerales archaeon]MDW8044381.1 CBS domain-containing protein [Nitrososphaerota archaeon]
MSLRIGKLLGVPVKLHFTLVLAVLLIVWTLAVGYLPSEYPGLSVMTYYLIGVISAFILFTSVLLHELAHSYVAKKNGLPVRRIVLFIFGGVAEIEEEPKEARVEFKMALAGPLTSFAIGLILWILHYPLSVFGVVAIASLRYGAYINLLLGAFNLLPAFPLDGGRILRAMIWYRKKDLLQATKIATKFGVFFSYIFIFSGFLFIIGGSFIGGLWFILIGWFLRNGAEASYRQTIVSEALADVLIKDIMTRDVHTVDPDLPIKDIIETHFMKYKHGGFPVVKDSKLIGLITLEDIKKVPREKWQETRVSDVMTHCEKLKCASPNETAADALIKMSKFNIGRLPVQEDGRLVGIITRSDIMYAIRIKTELEGRI